MSKTQLDIETLEAFAFKTSREVDGILSVRIDEEKNKLGFVVQNNTQRSHAQIRREIKELLNPMTASVRSAEVGLWSTIGKGKQPDFALTVKNH